MLERQREGRGQAVKFSTLLPRKLVSIYYNISEFLIFTLNIIKDNYSFCKYDL